MAESTLNCSSCTSTIERVDLSITCDWCNKNFHTHCLGYSKTLASNIIKSRKEVVWMCSSCREEHPIKKIKEESNPNESLPIMIRTLEAKVDEIRVSISQSPKMFLKLHRIHQRI